MPAIKRSRNRIRTVGTAQSGSIGQLGNVKKGVLSPRVFVDPDIYGLEQERVFTRCWLFVAHESEIPGPGDFVTRTMGEDPVIVWRGQDGRVRVFLNVCRHRGRRVCSADLGKASRFQCPYHGWTYDTRGELISVPLLDGYGGRLEMDQLGLYPAPRVDSYHGLVFANWDREGMPLSDYLGGIKWVLDVLFGRADGMVVSGPPMRWEAPANWKLGAANFGGDGQHTFTTHGFQQSVGLELIRGKSETLSTEKGHTAALKQWLPGANQHPYLALPRELWPELENRLTKHQLDVTRSLATVVGNVFPNMSFLNTVVVLPPELSAPDSRVLSFLTLRLWQPRQADRMEVWTWLFMEKNAPQWWEKASRELYVRSFGMGGVFEQDDMENWVDITRALQGPVARRLDLQYKMGLKPTPVREWPGPESVYAMSSFSELNERVFYRRWQELLMKGEPVHVK